MVAVELELLGVFLYQENQEGCCLPVVLVETCAVVIPVLLGPEGAFRLLEWLNKSVSS